MSNTIVIPAGHLTFTPSLFNLIADQYLTIPQLGNVFQTLTSSILGLSGTDIDDFVRLAWPTDGSPAWKIDEDKCFIQVVQESEPYDKQRNVTYTNIDGINSNQDTDYTRVIRVNWIFYGPNSSLYADNVKDALFFQKNHDVLAQYGIYLVPDIVAPSRVPEIFQHRWWERVDLHALFYDETIRNTPVPWVADIPMSITVNNKTIIVQQ